MLSDQRFQAVDAVATEVVDGELVLLQLKNGVYFGLDPLGTQIWNWLVAGCSLSQIVSEIEIMHPNESSEVLRSDLHALVEQLLAADLVQPLTPNAPLGVAS